MNNKERKPKILNKDLSYIKRGEKDSNICESQRSFNETPVDTLDPEISRWIKVIKPSRASLTYERYE